MVLERGKSEISEMAAVRYELAVLCRFAVDVIEIPSILHAPQKFYSCLSCVLGPFIPPFGCRDLRLLAPSTRSRSRPSREGRRLLPPCLPPGPATIEPNNNRNHEARPLHSSCRFCCRFCSWCSGFPFGYPAARVQGAITKEIVAGYFRLSTLLSSSWFELQAAAVELAVRSAMTNILYHKIWVL